jgi:hypothetical protein
MGVHSPEAFSALTTQVVWRLDRTEKYWEKSPYYLVIVKRLLISYYASFHKACSSSSCRPWSIVQERQRQVFFLRFFSAQRCANAWKGMLRSWIYFKGWTRFIIIPYVLITCFEHKKNSFVLATLCIFLY